MPGIRAASIGVDAGLSTIDALFEHGDGAAAAGTSSGIGASQQPGIRPALDAFPSRSSFSSDDVRLSPAEDDGATDGSGSQRCRY